eukprot:TRINITY_DN3346_c0_g1_i1.p1 TRINITY_DN3346_c0_g1~~TRINITY_DN3346_c0_g1_i1.p1  ORF type:complete len:445 (-),score=79.69 TRINITY_DN3346_c0_g1_i1:232-1566(-)
MENSSEELDLNEVGQGVSGGGREARLLRICEKLKQRVDELRKENGQLEELLQTAESNATGSNTDIERLEDELAKLSAEKISLEALVQHTLNNKGEEVDSLHTQISNQSEQINRLQIQIQTLEENNANLLSDRSDSEHKLFQSLRSELNKVEQHLENERKDHLQSRQEFATRQFALEQEISQSATALSQLQHKLEQKEKLLNQAEQQNAILKGERAQLRISNEQLQEKLLSIDTFQTENQNQQQISQDQFDQLQQQLNETQIALKKCQSELQSERDSKIQNSQNSNFINESELQLKLQDCNELLWQKQKQLEQLAADKAALQFELEREVNNARQEVDQLRKRNKSQQQYQYEQIVPMEALGEAYMKLANNERVGRAVRAGAHVMDISAQNIVNLIKKHPLGRLLLLLYLVFIHLFIYILIGYMQRSAIQAEEVQGNSSLRTGVEG